MGKRFLRSVVQDVATLTASADITPVDLPVNPLSHLVLTILLTLSPAQAATANMRRVQPFMDMISDLSTRRLGEQLIQGSLQDLAVLNACLHGYGPHGREFHGTNTIVRAMSFLLSFSRRPYWHEEGLPPSKRGELRFHMTAAALPVGYTAAQWALESVELIEDEPKQELKYTTSTKTLTASGDFDATLPLGNEIVGVLLFDPSDEIDATAQYAWGKVKLLKDNVEQYYPSSNWESLAEVLGRRVPSWQGMWGHRHEQLAADTITGEEVQTTADRPPLQYGYLDFDPLVDGSFSLETQGVSDLKLRSTSDVAAGTVRYLPVELRKIGGK